MHVINQHRSKGSLVSVSDSSSPADESNDNESDVKSDGGSKENLESKSTETFTLEELYSKATGHTKWKKRDRKSAKKDVDSVEAEMFRTECFKKPVEQQKDKDELSGSLVASQLKSLQPGQNTMAKVHVNQTCFQLKMPHMGLASLGYPGSQNFVPMPSHSFQQGDYNYIPCVYLTAVESVVL